MSERPADFDAFWNAVDAELAATPANPELVLTPRRSTEFSTSYDVRLTSIGHYRIFGYLSIPHGDGPFPALLQTPGYGSVLGPPHYDDKARYVCFAVTHRGQRLADQPWAASYPGLLTHGINSPREYIYRSIVADCIRGAEFLASRPEVDPNRIGISGTDLAIITAARRPIFATLLAQNLLHYRLIEARKRTEAYPVEELNDYLRFFPALEEQVEHTLSYVDPAHFAPAVTATTLVSMQDPGGLNGPEWIEPLRSAFGGLVETYPLTHEGGTDFDAIDAWFSKRQQVGPRPRMWEVVP
jgi:cephalosporin-C deacetylase